MKKAIWITCLVACLAFCLGNEGCEVETAEHTEESLYKINYLPSEENPQIAVVVALKKSYTAWTDHCSDALSKGLKGLSEKYVVGEKITPIVGHYSDASVTVGLIVHISPKE